MKTIHIILIIVVLCLLGLGAAAASMYAKNKASNDPDGALGSGGASGSSGSSGSGTAKVLDGNKKLGIGSKGEEVKELQRLFNAGGGQPKLVEDGVFGAKTLGAVIKVIGFGTVSTTLSAFRPAIANYTKELDRKSSQDSDVSFLKKLLNL